MERGRDVPQGSDADLAAGVRSGDEEAAGPIARAEGARNGGHAALTGASTGVVASLGVIILGALLAASLFGGLDGDGPSTQPGATLALPPAKPVVVEGG